MKQEHHHRPQPSVSYNAQKTKTAYQRLRTLSSSIRVEIINYMAKREQTVASKEIAEHFHLNPTEAQQHLDLLSKANYITNLPSAHNPATYTTNKNRLIRIVKLVKELVQK